MLSEGSAGRRPEPIIAAFERLSGSVSTLVRDHLELAKIELREAVRSATHDAIVIGSGVGVLVVAHALLMTALALGLARVMPAWLGFLLVGLANAAAGATLIHRRIKVVRARQLPAVLPLPSAES